MDLRSCFGPADRVVFLARMNTQFVVGVQGCYGCEVASDLSQMSFAFARQSQWLQIVLCFFFHKFVLLGSSDLDSCSRNLFQNN